MLPDPRSPRGDARRLAGRHGGRDGAPRRRRHGRLRLDHAVPRRHPRRPGRPAEDPRDHGARRRLSRRARCRPLPGAGRIRQELAARPPLHAADGRGARGRANSPAGAMRWRGRCHGACEGRLCPITWWCSRQPFLWQGTCCPTRHPQAALGPSSFLRRNCWWANPDSWCTNARCLCPCVVDRLACGNSLISP